MVVELESHLAELEKVPQQIRDDLKELLTNALLPKEPDKSKVFLT